MSNIAPSNTTLSARYQEKFPDAVRRYGEEAILANTRAFIDALVRGDDAQNIEPSLAFIRQKPPAIDIYADLSSLHADQGLAEYKTPHPLHLAILKFRLDVILALKEAGVDLGEPIKRYESRPGRNEESLYRVLWLNLIPGIDNRNLSDPGICLARHWIEAGWPLSMESGLDIPLKAGVMFPYVRSWVAQCSEAGSLSEANVRQMIIDLSNLKPENADQMEIKAAMDLLLENPEINRLINDGYNGFVGLCRAVRAGNMAAVRALLEHGVNPDARPDHEITPLCVAIYFLNDEAYRALRKAGAPIDLLPSKPFKHPEDYNDYRVLSRPLFRYLIEEDFDGGVRSILKDIHHDDHEQKVHAFGVIMRDAFRAGYDPTEPIKTGNHLYPSLMDWTSESVGYGGTKDKRYFKLTKQLVKEGVCPSSARSKEVNKYHIKCQPLWKAFEGGYNPYLSGAKPIEEVVQDQSALDMLTDHPYSLLQLFSSMGRLSQAMDKTYWPGEGGEAARRAALEALYPYQKKYVAREYVDAVRRGPIDDQEKPLSRWRACVSESTGHRTDRGRVAL